MKKVPAMNDILNNNCIADLIENYGRNFIKSKCQKIIKTEIANGAEFISIDQIYNRLLDELKDKYHLKKVVNGSGVILHTNLGRSLISKEVMQRVMDIATSYSNLELDLQNGKRGSRYSHVEKLLCELTGAEAALVVNNNAAAVMLVLSTLFKDKEVLVSRGELVEIGGSFRIPEVISSSGGIIKEVGATNKTHLYDYEKALDENIGGILKVHTSNYRIVGFSDSVDLIDLADLAHKNNLPLVNDLGSGSLLDMRDYGLPYEPTVQEAILKGCDIVTFSGDKLLGGPQAGIIVGKKDYVDQMKKNQLLRALRIDKMTLAALEATLLTYKENVNQIPIYKFLSEPIDNLEKRIKNIIEAIDNSNIVLNCIDSKAKVGGGAFPENLLRSKALVVKHSKYSNDQLKDKLRSLDIPIIARIENNNLEIDFKTIVEDEDKFIIDALNTL